MIKENYPMKVNDWKIGEHDENWVDESGEKPYAK